MWLMIDWGTGGQVSRATVLSHDLFTNDVLYAEVALNLRPVPTHLLPLVPLFCRCAALVHGGAAATSLRMLWSRDTP